MSRNVTPNEQGLVWSRDTG